MAGHWKTRQKQPVLAVGFASVINKHSGWIELAHKLKELSKYIRCALQVSHNIYKLQKEYSSLAKYIHRKTGQSLVGDTEIERFFIGRNWGTTSEAEIHIRQIAKNETRAGLLRRFDLEKETETLP